MPKERDYAKEWQREKARRAETEVVIRTKVSPQIAADFTARCEDNGMTRYAAIKEFVIRYANGDIDL